MRDLGKADLDESSLCCHQEIDSERITQKNSNGLLQLFNHCLKSSPDLQCLKAITMW